MSPETLPNPKSLAGVLRLNGLVWGIIVLGWVNAVASTSGPFQGLGGIFLILLAAAVGAGMNAVLGIWKMSRGNRYQAALYFLTMIPLAILTVVLSRGLSHIGKIGG